ncbi:hypothetical protein GCM10022261_10730 [Brevibacterium daeguense]|uniref:HTH arsR-type domain-containing protein n=1 Tax=Brevibacterium daeguense TaxID=909936 RepID=A0ABP8EHX5_9MICO
MTDQPDSRFHSDSPPAQTAGDAGDAYDGLDHVNDTAAIERSAELFKALATPSRLRILLVLSHGPSTVTNIVDHTGLYQPLVSQHLKLLRGLHLVSVERRGREAIYSLSDDHVAHIILDALAHTQEPKAPID